MNSKAAILPPPRRNKNVGQRYGWHARRRNGRVDKGNTVFHIGPYGRRLNVWPYNVGYNQTTKDKAAFTHSALMPDAEAEDLIVSYSRPGDLVVDPFSGVGTTAKMALLNDRKYLGYEIDPTYCQTAQERLATATTEHRQRLDRWLDVR